MLTAGLTGIVGVACTKIPSQYPNQVLESGEWSAGSRSWVDLETPRCFPDPSFKGCIDAGGRRLDL